MSSSINNIACINTELQQVSEWLKLNKLSLNVKKTKAMIFHTIQRNITLPELYIDGTKIDFVTTFNYLGLMVDQNLSWKNHVDAVAKKISKTLGIMTKLKHILPSHALLNIYNALVLSHLNYGLIVWGGKSSRLLKLQKRAVRIICKSSYNSHTDGLFRKLNLLKINDLCALQDYKFCYKMHHSLLPEYFLCDMIQALNVNRTHTHATRYFDNLRMPAVKHEFARHCISYKYPLTINNMPQNFKEKLDTHSFFGFKFYFKRTTLITYNNECQNMHCFVCQT
jgi:hypothetical protein